MIWRIAQENQGQSLEAIIQISDKEEHSDEITLAFDVAPIKTLKTKHTDGVITVDEPVHPLNGLSVSFSQYETKDKDQITLNELVVQDLADSGDLPEYVTAIGPVFSIGQEQMTPVSSSANAVIFLDNLQSVETAQLPFLRLFVWTHNTEIGDAWVPVAFSSTHLKAGKLAVSPYLLGIPMRFGIVPEIFKDSEVVPFLESSLSKSLSVNKFMAASESPCTTTAPLIHLCKNSVFQVEFKEIENSEWGKSIEYPVLFNKLYIAYEKLLALGLYPETEIKVTSNKLNFSVRKDDDSLVRGKVSLVDRFQTLMINPDVKDPLAAEQVLYHEFFHNAHLRIYPEFVPMDQLSWISEGLANWFAYVAIERYSNWSDLDEFPAILVSGLASEEHATICICSGRWLIAHAGDWAIILRWLLYLRWGLNRAIMRLLRLPLHCRGVAIREPKPRVSAIYFNSSCFIPMPPWQRIMLHF